ncbi:MAG: hypothetical protein CME93_09045 [Hyphomonadaceae bacterium]|nr:hypothetical protein [Hyphomonadaceae bacterium]
MVLRQHANHINIDLYVLHTPRKFARFSAWLIIAGRPANRPRHPASLGILTIPATLNVWASRKLLAPTPASDTCQDRSSTRHNCAQKGTKPLRKRLEKGRFARPDIILAGRSIIIDKLKTASYQK